MFSPAKLLAAIAFVASIVLSPAQPATAGTSAPTCPPGRVFNGLMCIKVTVIQIGHSNTGGGPCPKTTTPPPGGYKKQAVIKPHSDCIP